MINLLLSTVSCYTKQEVVHLKQQYQVWRKKLIEDCAKLLQAIQASLLHLREKKVREKENFTKAVMKFGI